MSQANRAILLLFGVCGFCMGMFLAAPLANIIFHSTKPTELIDAWALLAFAAECGGFSASAPYSVLLHDSVLNKNSWKRVLVLTIIGLVAFTGIAALGGLIFTRIHILTLHASTWLLTLIFLLIPALAGLTVLWVGKLNLKRQP